MAIRLALLLLVLASCTQGPAPVVVPLRSDPELAVRLTFDSATAWFMFDTGAGAHTLARWFVDRAGMELEDSAAAGVRARDAAGQPVDLRIIRDQVGLLPDGSDLVIGSAIVADFPPEFEAWEMGGLINPQLLAHDGQAAVLDLRVPELRIEPFGDAVRRLGAEIVADDRVRLCRESGAPVSNLVYALLVTSRNGSDWLQLDTGAGETSIAAGSPLVQGEQLEPGGEMMGVAGRPIEYSIARNLTLSFAGSRATVDAQVVDVPRGGCSGGGLLGRDALGRCALVLGPDSVAVACPS